MEVVNALIVKNKRILLVQDEHNKWSLPGGKVESDNHSHHDTLIKWLETNLGITPTALAQTSCHNQEMRGYYFLVYIAIITDQIVGKRGFGWFMEHEVQHLEVDDNLKSCRGRVRALLRSYSNE